jgi:hypothetical protein
MKTLAKTQVNRSNALKSTGPRTPEGKAVVAWNAVKHGLLSREVLLPEENRAAFRALATGLWEYLQPVGTLECLLADRVVAAAWRLRRVHVIEADLFDWFPRFTGPQSLGTVFAQSSEDEGAFLKLSRYEAAIERGFFRALHELERLQARRLGADVPPPVTVDVDVAFQVSEEMGK